MTNLAGRAALCVLASGVLACASLSAQQTVPTFKQTFLYQLGDTEKKLVSLAEAVPQEKYAWRPGDGVRSFSEVFMHEAGSNVFFMTFVGVKPPASFDPKGEKTVTEKEKIVQAMKDSFAHVRTAVSAMTEEDLQKSGKFMGGRTMTYQNILFVMSDHMHEHLGQLIAYARVNGITPPWSAKGTD